MFNEFHGDELGSAVLDSYEIPDTNIKHDCVVLLCYSVVSTQMQDVTVYVLPLI